MMRSLFTGVSGLRVHQTKMDVIANNIANVNTVGFKSSRVTFNEVFYQRIQGASAANPDTGRAGTNPMQIGLGVSVASIDNIMTQGASQRTDNAMDVMIQGSGFFIVTDGSGTYFTRAGNIAMDKEYNLHINGLHLMGWDTVKENGEWVVAPGPVKELQLSGEKQYVPPAATTIMNVMGNLNASEEPVVTRTMEFYDSVGNMYTVDVKFTYHPEQNTAGTNPTPPSDHFYSYWEYEFDADSTTGLVRAYPDNDRDNEKLIAINVGDLTGDVTITGTTPNPPFNKKGLLVFDTKGDLAAFGAFDASIDLSAGNVGTAPNQLTVRDDITTTPALPATLSRFGKSNPPAFNLLIAPINILDPTAILGSGTNAGGHQIVYGSGTRDIGTLQLNFSQFTQYSGEHTNVKMLYKDGNAPGTLQDLSIGSDGIITGRYSNGQTKVLGQIPLANFINPMGLEKVGNNLYVVTPNSGQFDGAGEAGVLMGGVLEMSNVDLSQEFTEMITTQRGFQASSRIITVSDDMLQELVNLKR